jgi:soluble lytic murein transglycosylase
MSSRAATLRGRPRGGAAARRRRALQRRRRAFLVLGVGFLAVVGALVVAPMFRHAVREISLPLRHEDIIRQQARDKGVDAALVAGVIYTETHFRPRTSAAGAEGLMQLLPSTAEFIARRSGGTRFAVADLATPQVNIAYGTWYLRYLARRYGNNEVLEIAAYNGGETNVDRWLVHSSRSGRTFRAQDIPFPETRAYVERVLRARDRYRDTYADELGLAERPG